MQFLAALLLAAYCSYAGRQPDMVDMVAAVVTAAAWVADEAVVGVGTAAPGEVGMDAMVAGVDGMAVAGTAAGITVVAAGV